jgi:hypothetical protein
MIRFLPMILVGSVIAVVGSLVQSGYIHPKQPSDTPRTPVAFCQEVSREVNIQAYEGMISPSKARQISRRCQELYLEEQ